MKKLNFDTLKHCTYHPLTLAIALVATIIALAYTTATAGANEVLNANQSRQYFVDDLYHIEYLGKTHPAPPCLNKGAQTCMEWIQKRLDWYTKQGWKLVAVDPYGKYIFEGSKR